MNDVVSQNPEQPSPLPLAPGDDGEVITLGAYAERAYLDYAVSVVKGRALPECADGQKPVQRRILFAMNEMGLKFGSKPVKSARVVGDVLGKFHPHGDQAAYEALVRMAQGFTLRYPLIDGQGNFGSRDGDGAAAMRYTEARLTPIARLLLDEIDMGTVNFAANYDGSMQEPKLLPARLPFVLLNGASGIAVGMATDIPSHNLREVAEATIRIINHPNTSLDVILKDMPGPDFPGGGQIISAPQLLHDIYASGRGSLKVRARWRLEELARGQWQCVVYELPPNTSSARVLQDIEELTNPKIKLGKKTLSADQQTLKTQFLSLLDAVRDESNQEYPVRLVFEPKSRNVDADGLMNALLSHTSLEGNVSINLVSIGIDGRPAQRCLLAMLQDWVQFRKHCMVRRSQHRLAQVHDRIHVLQGRLIAWLNIDEVIRIIRESDEPKSALIAAFGLSPRQADDILDIRLRQLARLEKIKLEEELAALQHEEVDLQALLSDEGKLKSRMVAEIRQDTKTHGDARRTLIEEASRAVLDIQRPAEPLTVIVSQNFWVRSRQGHGLDAAQWQFKMGDGMYAAFEGMSTDSTYFFGAGSASGRVYSVPVSTWPGGRGDGLPAPSVLDMAGGNIAHALVATPQQALLLANSGGYGFVCQASDLEARSKAGKQFIGLEADEILLLPICLQPEHTLVAVLSKAGRLHVFDLADIKTLHSGGRGVQLLALQTGDTLLSCVALAAGQNLILQGLGKTGKPKQQVLAASNVAALKGPRGRKGREHGVGFAVQGLEVI